MLHRVLPRPDTSKAAPNFGDPRVQSYLKLEAELREGEQRSQKPFMLCGGAVQCCPMLQMNSSSVATLDV